MKLDTLSARNLSLASTEMQGIHKPGLVEPSTHLGQEEEELMAGWKSCSCTNIPPGGAMVQHSQPFRPTSQDCWGLQGLPAQEEQDFISQVRAKESLKLYHSSQLPSISFIESFIKSVVGRQWGGQGRGQWQCQAVPAAKFVKHLLWERLCGRHCRVLERRGAFEETHPCRFIFPERKEASGG